MTLPVSAITKAAEQFSLPDKTTTPPAGDPAGGFGQALSNAIGSLEKTQETAAAQSQALATGQTSDLSSVITAVQEAQLSMQLASQVRNKAVEAYTEIFHTQI
jgi:flagellar hook-basal body complex protein FliE